MFASKLLFSTLQQKVWNNADIFHIKALKIFLGDRRIRVHTLSLPVLTNTTHVYSAVDINTTISLLSKMGKYNVGKELNPKERNLE